MAKVHYKTFDGEQVSAQWFTVLTSARNAGVRFRLNEGHRTFARQKYFWDGWQARRPGFARAAPPTHNAPHIRTGRIDHAVDIESTDGGAQRLIRWMQKNGLRAVLTVRGEPWHIESDTASLVRYHKKRKPSNKLAPLTKTERKLVEKRYYHYDQLIAEGRRGRTAKYRKHLGWARYYKARIRVQARAIRIAARRSGWKKHNRSKRYQLLKDAYHHRLRL